MNIMMFDPDVAHFIAANKYRPQFLAAIGIGLGDLLGGLFAAAPEVAAIGADVAAPAIAADVALPEIAVTAAAPEIAGGAAGLGTLGGVGAAGLGAGLDLSGALGGAAAGGLATAADVGGGVLGATDLTGALAAPGAGGLSDTAITSLLQSPGAQAFADVGQAGRDFGSTFAAVSPPGDLPTTTGGLIDPNAPGMPSWMGDPAAYNYGAVTPGAGAGGTAPFTPGAAPGAVAGGDPAYTWGAGGIPGITSSGAPVTGGMVPPGATAPGFFDQAGAALAPAGNALKSAAPWLGAAGLGYNLWSGYQSNQALKALQQQETNYQNTIAQAGQAALTAAQPMLATGTALTQGGPLPAPMQALLDNYRNQQRARIIQGYAARDPTNPAAADPKLNSALAQELNAVDSNMLALQESIGNQMIQTANQMLTSGASSTQIAAELPMMMQRLDIALQQQTGNAIANFAAAMSGGTMKVAGQGSGSNINLNLTSPNQTNTQSLLGP